MLKASNLDKTDEHEDTVTYKLSFFVLLISNTCLLMANILTFASLIPRFVTYDSDVERYINILLGLAGFFSWMNVLTIMSISSYLSPVAESLHRTVREVTLLLYGIVPIFFAFLFSGYCAFHTHERFESLKKMSASLGAILCGDEVTSFIYAATEFGTIGLVYSMGFCMIFMVCIHNVLIFVVAEAFRAYIIETSKKKHAIAKQTLSRRNTWVKKQFSETNFDAEMRNNYRKSAISNNLYKQKQLLEDKKDIESTKQKLFYSIVPQYKDSHIQELNLRKDFIIDDLKHLRETLYDVMEEPLGNYK